MVVFKTQGLSRSEPHIHRNTVVLEKGQTRAESRNANGEEGAREVGVGEGRLGAGHRTNALELPVLRLPGLGSPPARS